MGRVSHKTFQSAEGWRLAIYQSHTDKHDRVRTLSKELGTIPNTINHRHAIWSL